MNNSMKILGESGSVYNSSPSTLEEDIVEMRKYFKTEMSHALNALSRLTARDYYKDNLENMCDLFDKTINALYRVNTDTRKLFDKIEVKEMSLGEVDDCGKS